MVHLCQVLSGTEYRETIHVSLDNLCLFFNLSGILDVTGEVKG